MSVYYLLNTAIVLTRYIYLFSGLQTIVGGSWEGPPFWLALKLALTLAHVLLHIPSILQQWRESKYLDLLISSH